MGSLFIYIRSYLRVHHALLDTVAKYHLRSEQLFQTETWVNILILSILVALILVGMLMIYIYYQKVIGLYRLQQNFINGFTHELKTPLASIQLFLESFKMHEMTRAEQLKYVEFMLKDTKRLTQNVSRILQLGKIEEKNFKPELEELNIVEVVESFLKNTPHLFDEISIEFKNELESFYMPIDRNLFEMLMMNLINNAIIYNKSSEKKLLIKLSSDKNIIRLSFKDNGIGLDKSMLKKIFKKFFQVGKTAKGSGLGLYIVQAIAKLHNADVVVKSDGINQGSEFIFFKKINRKEFWKLKEF